MMLRSGLRGVKVFRQLYNFLPQRNYGTVPAKTGVPAIHQSISKSVKREMSTLKEVSTLKESTLSGKEVPGKEVSTLKESTLSGKEVPGKELSLLKVSSNGSRDLYAICRIHNMPYLVTEGDKIYLPFKLKNVCVGDVLNLKDVVTLGSTTYTLNMPSGIDSSFYTLRASVQEITREPLYQVVRKRQRCRRKKTYQVEPFQTVLIINELKLR